MTRIVLLLTAIPLAAVLALVLNTILDRRVAALEISARRISKAALRSGLPLALALASSLAAAPLVAQVSQPDCASLDCSLFAEADRVDRLWKHASDARVVVVAQSRIPVAFDTALDRWDADRRDAIAGTELQSRLGPEEAGNPSLTASANDAPKPRD